MDDQYITRLKECFLLYKMALTGHWEYVCQFIDLSRIDRDKVPMALAKAMDELMPKYRAGLPLPEMSTDYLLSLLSTVRCSTCGSVSDEVTLCVKCGRIMCPNCCTGCVEGNGECS